MHMQYRRAALFVLFMSLAITSTAALADVQLMTQSARILARASYTCSETDSDVNEVENVFNDTSALDEQVNTSITGSCGYAQGEAQIQSGITTEQISSTGYCGAGGSGPCVELPGDYGAVGRGELFYEVTFRLTEATQCSYFADSSVGGQGCTGGAINLTLFSSDGTVYFDDSWFSVYVPDVILPAGDYTLRANGQYNGSDGGGGANHQLWVTFADPVVVPMQKLSFGALKGRF